MAEIAPTFLPPVSLDYRNINFSPHQRPLGYTHSRFYNMCIYPYSCTLGYRINTTGMMSCCYRSLNTLPKTYTTGRTFFFFFCLAGKFARKELYILAMVWWSDGTHKEAPQTTLEWRVRRNLRCQMKSHFSHTWIHSHDVKRQPSVSVNYTSLLWHLSVLFQSYSGLREQAAGSGHADVQTQRHFPFAL